MTQLEMKKIIRRALEENELDAVAALVRKDKKSLSQLIRMAYDKETLVGWRAIRAIGLAAKALVVTDYEFLRITVRKLLWSLSDESGGIGWAAPEILGEIVSADPEQFRDIIPLIAEVYTIEEDVFRAGILYALSRIAETAPERVAEYQNIIIMSLKDKDPLVKINSLDLVKKIYHTARKKDLWSLEYRKNVKTMLESLKKDHGVAWIYINNGFIGDEVGEKANNVLEIIQEDLH